MSQAEDQRLKYTRNIGIMAHIDAGNLYTVAEVFEILKKEKEEAAA